MRILPRYCLISAGLALAVACNNDASPPTPSPGASASTTEPPVESAPAGKTRQRTVYVPAYSHLPSAPNPNYDSQLSILLSVRNVDTAATITLNHVDYFDTSGHRVRRYLKAPRILKPLSTAEYMVPAFDETGGSGANFLVYWEGPSDAHPLLTEAVMLGHLGAGYAAFTSRGVELQRRPDAKDFVDGKPPPPAAHPVDAAADGG